jgi:hypothetical protein
VSQAPSTSMDAIENGGQLLLMKRRIEMEQTVRREKPRCADGLSLEGVSLDLK